MLNELERKGFGLDHVYCLGIVNSLIVIGLPAVRFGVLYKTGQEGHAGLSPANRILLIWPPTLAGDGW